MTAALDVVHDVDCDGIAVCEDDERSHFDHRHIHDSL